MPGYNKFKGFLVEQGIKQQEVADLLSMDRARLNLILNGQRGRDFRIHEVRTICEHYKISPDEYFFKTKVSN